VDLNVGAQPDDVKIEDLDKDGNLDLVVGNFGTPGNYKTGSISILLQDSANPGVFLPADNYNFSCRAKDISLGDLNDDGFLDIAVASACPGCRITILFQDITTIGTFLPATHYSCAFSAWSIAVGDLNNDNFNDLIVSDDDVATQLQDPAAPGTFLGRTTIYDPD
jgi:hypothetical protein